jgi:hypothetical protein
MSAKLGRSISVRLQGKRRKPARGMSWPTPPRRRRLNKLRPLVRAVATAFPQAQVELWTMNEHHIGLRPILHKVWSVDGQRPDELEDAQAARCVALQAQPDRIRSTTIFRWWPRRIKKRQGPRKKLVSKLTNPRQRRCLKTCHTVSCGVEGLPAAYSTGGMRSKDWG